MATESIYFTDNFFSAGRTEIFDEKKVKVGELDLKSSFSASVDVLTLSDEVVIKGKFRFFSNKWNVSGQTDHLLGELKAKFSFFTKKFEYRALKRGIYTIESPVFSKEYQIFDQHSTLVAHFERVSGFFSSPAFRLINYSENLSTNELIVIVMGVNAIQKRQRSNASAGGAN